MNLNAAQMGGYSDISRAEILIHELLHFAGINHNPWPAGNPTGHDRVYGCGRYCTKCQSAVTAGGSNSALGFSWDCADCADDNRKDLCGYRIFGTDGDESVCDAAGEGTDCTNCYIDQKMSCDAQSWTPLPKADLSACCAGCSDCSPGCVAGIADPTDGQQFDSCGYYPIGFCTSGF